MAVHFSGLFGVHDVSVFHAFFVFIVSGYQVDKLTHFSCWKEAFLYFVAEF